MADWTKDELRSFKNFRARVVNKTIEELEASKVDINSGLDEDLGDSVLNKQAKVYYAELRKLLDEEIGKRTAGTPSKGSLTFIENAVQSGMGALLDGVPTTVVTDLGNGTFMFENGEQRALIDPGKSTASALGHAAFTQNTSWLDENRINTDIIAIESERKVLGEKFITATQAEKQAIAGQIGVLTDQLKLLYTDRTNVKRGIESTTDVFLTTASKTTTYALAEILSKNANLNVFGNVDDMVERAEGLAKRDTPIAKAIKVAREVGAVFKDVVGDVNEESGKFIFHPVEVGRGVFGVVVEDITTSGKFAIIPMVDNGKENAVKKLLTGFGELNAIYMQAPTTSTQIIANSSTGYMAFYGGKIPADSIATLISDKYAYKLGGARSLKFVGLYGGKDNLDIDKVVDMLDAKINIGAGTDRVRVEISDPLDGQLNSVVIHRGVGKTIVKSEVARLNDAKAADIRNMAVDRTDDAIRGEVPPSTEAEQVAFLDELEKRTSVFDVLPSTGEGLSGINPNTVKDLSPDEPMLATGDSLRDAWFKANIKEGNEADAWNAIRTRFKFNPNPVPSEVIGKVAPDHVVSDIAAKDFDWRGVLNEREPRFGRRVNNDERLIDILTNRNTPDEAQRAFDLLVDHNYIDVPVGAEDELLSNVAGRHVLIAMYDDVKVSRGDVYDALVKDTAEIATKYKISDPERVFKIEMHKIIQSLGETDARVMSTFGTEVTYNRQAAAEAIAARKTQAHATMEWYGGTINKYRIDLQRIQRDVGVYVDISDRSKFEAAGKTQGMSVEMIDLRWRISSEARAKIGAKSRISTWITDSNNALGHALNAYRVPGAKVVTVKKGQKLTPAMPWAGVQGMVRENLLVGEILAEYRLESAVEMYKNAVDHLDIMATAKRSFTAVQEKKRKVTEAGALLDEINVMLAAGETSGPEFARYLREYENAAMSLRATNFALFGSPEVYIDYGSEKAAVVMANMVNARRAAIDASGVTGVVPPGVRNVVAAVDAIDKRVDMIRDTEFGFSADIKHTLEDFIRTRMYIYMKQMEQATSPEEYKKIMDKGTTFLQERLGLLPKEAQSDILVTIPKVHKLDELIFTAEPNVKKYGEEIVDAVVTAFDKERKWVPAEISPEHRYVVRNDVREQFSQELISMAKRREDLLIKLDTKMREIQRNQSRIWGIQRNAEIPGAGEATIMRAASAVISNKERLADISIVDLANAKEGILNEVGDIRKEILGIEYSWAKLISTNPVKYAGSVEALSNLTRLLHVPGYLTNDMDVMFTNMNVAALEKARILQSYHIVREVAEKARLGGDVTPEEYALVTDALANAINFDDKKLFTEHILPSVEEAIFINEPTIRRQQVAAHVNTIYNAFVYRMSVLDSRLDGAKSAIDKVVSYAVATSVFPTRGIERERFSHDAERAALRGYMVYVDPDKKISKYVLPATWNQGVGEHGLAMHMDLIRKYGFGYTKNGTQSAFVFPVRDELGKLAYKVNISYNVGMDHAEKILAEAEILAYRNNVTRIIAEVPSTVFTGVMVDKARYPILERYLTRVKTETQFIAGGEIIPQGIEGAGSHYGILKRNGADSIRRFTTVIASWNVIEHEALNQELFEASKDVTKMLASPMPIDLVHSIYDFMGEAVKQAGTGHQYTEYMTEAGLIRESAANLLASKALGGVQTLQMAAVDEFLRRNDAIVYENRTSKAMRSVRNLAKPRIPMLLYVDKDQNIRISLLQDTPEMRKVLNLGNGIKPTDSVFSVIIDQAADGAYEIKNRVGELPDKYSYEIIYHKVLGAINSMTNGFQEMSLTQASAREIKLREEMDKRLSREIRAEWYVPDPRGGQVRHVDTVTRADLFRLRADENALHIRYVEDLKAAAEEAGATRKGTEEAAIREYKISLDGLYKRYIKESYKFASVARIKREYLGVAGEEKFGIGAADVDGTITRVNKMLGAGGITIRFDGTPRPEFAAELFDAEIERLIKQRNLPGFADIAPIIQERIAALRAGRMVAANTHREITIMPGSMPTFNKLIFKKIMDRAIALRGNVSKTLDTSQELVIDRLQQLAAEARDGVFISEHMLELQRLISDPFREWEFTNSNLTQLVGERDALMTLRQLTPVQGDRLQQLKDTITRHEEITRLRENVVMQMQTIGKVAVENFDTIATNEVVQGYNIAYARMAGTPFLQAVGEVAPQTQDFADTVLGINRDYVGLFEELEAMREYADTKRTKRDSIISQRRNMLLKYTTEDIKKYESSISGHQVVIDTFEDLYWNGRLRRYDDPIMSATSLKKYIEADGKMFRYDQLPEVKQVFRDAIQELIRKGDQDTSILLQEMLDTLESRNMANWIYQSDKYDISAVRGEMDRSKKEVQRLREALATGEDTGTSIKLQELIDQLTAEITLAHSRIEVLTARVDVLPHAVRGAYSRYAVIGLRPKIKLQNIDSELKDQRAILIDPLKSAKDKEAAQKVITLLEKERDNVLGFMEEHAKDIEILEKQIAVHAKEYGSKDKLSVPYLEGQVKLYRARADNIRAEIGAAQAVGTAVTKEQADLVIRYESTARMLEDSMRSKSLLYKQLHVLYAEEQATRADIITLRATKPEYRQISVWATKYVGLANKMDAQSSGIKQIEKVLAANDGLWFFKSLFMDVDDVRKMLGKTIQIAMGKQEPFIHEIRQRRIDLGLMRAVNKMAQNRVVTIMGFMDQYLKAQGGLGFGQHPGVAEGKAVFTGVKERKALMKIMRESVSPYKGSEVSASIEIIKSLSNFSNFYVDFFDDDMVNEVRDEMVRNKLGTKVSQSDIASEQGLAKIERLLTSPWKKEENERVAKLGEVYRGALRRAFLRHLESEGVHDISAVEADTLVDRALDMMIGYQKSFDEMVMGRAQLARVLDRNMDMETIIRQHRAAEGQEAYLSMQATVLKRKIVDTNEIIHGGPPGGRRSPFGKIDKMWQGIEKEGLHIGMTEDMTKDEWLARIIPNLDNLTTNGELLRLRDELNTLQRQIQDSDALINVITHEQVVVKRRKVGLYGLMTGKTSINATVENTWFDVSLFDNLDVYHTMLERDGRSMTMSSSEMAIFMPGQSGPNKIVNLYRIADNKLHPGSSRLEHRIYEGILGQLFVETGLQQGINARDRTDMAEALSVVMRNKFGILIEEMYRIPGVETAGETYSRITQLAMRNDVFMQQVSKAMRTFNIKADGVAVDISRVLSRFVEERFKGMDVVEPFIKDMQSGIKRVVKQLRRGEVHVPYVDVQFALSDKDRARARELVALDVRGQLSPEKKEELSKLLSAWGESKPAVIRGIVPGMEKPEAIYKLMLLDDGRIVVVRDLYAFSGTEKIKGVRVPAPLNTEWIEQHLDDRVERAADKQVWDKTTESQFERKIIRVLREVPGVDKVTYEDLLRAQRKAQLLETLPEGSLDDAMSVVLEMMLTKGKAQVRAAQGEIRALGFNGIVDKYGDLLKVTNIDPYALREALENTPTMKSVVAMLSMAKVGEYEDILNTKEFMWYKEHIEAFIAIKSKIKTAHDDVEKYNREVLGKIRSQNAIPIGTNIKEVVSFFINKLTDPKEVSWGGEFRRLVGVADQSTKIGDRIGSIEREVRAIKLADENYKKGIKYVYDRRVNKYISIDRVKPIMLSDYITKVIEDLRNNNISLRIEPIPSSVRGLSIIGHVQYEMMWVDRLDAEIIANKKQTIDRGVEKSKALREKGAERIAQELSFITGIDTTAEALSVEAVDTYVDALARKLTTTVDEYTTQDIKAMLEGINTRGGVRELVAERQNMISKVYALNEIDRSSNLYELRILRGILGEWTEQETVEVIADKPYPLPIYKIKPRLMELEETLRQSRNELDSVNARAVLRRPTYVTRPPVSDIIGKYDGLMAVQAQLDEKVKFEENRIRALTRPFKVRLSKTKGPIDDATLAEFFKTNTEYSMALSELATIMNRADLTQAPAGAYSGRVAELIKKLDSISDIHNNASKINSAYVNMGEMRSVDVYIEEALASWWKHNKDALPKDLRNRITEEIVPMDATTVKKYNNALVDVKVLYAAELERVRGLEDMMNVSIEELIRHRDVVKAQEAMDVAQANVNRSELRAWYRANAVFAAVDKWLMEMTAAGKQDTVPVRKVASAFADVMDRNTFAIKDMRAKMISSFSELIKDGFLQKDVDTFLKAFDDPRAHADMAIVDMFESLDVWIGKRVRLLPEVNIIKESLFQSRMTSRMYIEILQHAVGVLADQSIPEEDDLVRQSSKFFMGTGDHIALAHLPPLLRYPDATEENLRMMREFTRNYDTTYADLYKNHDAYYRLRSNILNSGSREYSNAELQALLNRVGELEKLEWAHGITSTDVLYHTTVSVYLNSKKWNGTSPTQRKKIFALGLNTKYLSQDMIDAWDRVTSARTKSPGRDIAEQLEFEKLRAVLNQQFKLAYLKLNMVRDAADVRAMRVSGATSAYISDMSQSYMLRNMSNLNKQLIDEIKAYTKSIEDPNIDPLTGYVVTGAREGAHFYYGPDKTVFLRQGKLLDELARVNKLQKLTASQDTRTGGVVFSGITSVEANKLRVVVRSDGSVEEVLGLPEFTHDLLTITPERQTATDKIFNDIDRQLAKTLDKTTAPLGTEFKIRLEPIGYEKVLDKYIIDINNKLAYVRPPSMTDEEWDKIKVVSHDAFMQRLEELQKPAASTEAGVFTLRNVVIGTVHGVDTTMAHNDMVEYHKLIIGAVASGLPVEQRDTFITAATVYGQYFREALQVTGRIERYEALYDLWTKTMDEGAKARVNVSGTTEKGFEMYSERLGRLAVATIKAHGRLEELYTGVNQFLSGVVGIGAVIGRDSQMRADGALSVFIRQAIRVGRDAAEMHNAASALKMAFRSAVYGLSYTAKDSVGQHVIKMFGGQALSTFTGLKNILNHLSYYAYSVGGHTTDRHMRMLADDIADMAPWDPDGKNVAKHIEYITKAGTSWAEGKYGVRGNKLVETLVKSLDKSADDMSRMIVQGVSPQNAAAMGYRQVDAAYRNLKQGEETTIGDAGYDGANTALSYSYADNVQLISKLEYVAVNDSRTCKYCRSSDGIMYNVEDPKPSLPRHSNCRCTYRAWFRSPGEIVPGTDVTEQTKAVRLKRWINIGDEELGGVGAALNKLRPIKTTGAVDDTDWLKWFDEQKYPVREMMVGKDHALAHALGVFDDEDKFDKGRLVSAAARDIVSSAYSSTVKYSTIELAKNFVTHHEVAPNIVEALAHMFSRNPKAAMQSLRGIPFSRIMAQPGGIIQSSLTSGFNQMLGDVSGPGGALFSLANKYVPQTVMKMALEIGADLWNDVNRFLPHHISSRMTAKEKERPGISSAIARVLNKDGTYPDLTNAYARLMGMADIKNVTRHEDMVGDWWKTVEAFGDVMLNMGMEIKNPSGAGSVTKYEAIQAQMDEALLMYPSDEMGAVLTRRIKNSGALGEFEIKGPGQISTEQFETFKSALSPLYSRGESGIETISSAVLSDLKGAFTSGKMWDSPVLQRRVLALSTEQQSALRSLVGPKNQGQFDVLVQGGRIETELSRFRIKSVSANGDIYGYNDIPAYGVKEMWASTEDGHMYVGELDNIVDAFRKVNIMTDRSQFKKILMRTSPGMEGKMNISLMLDEASQTRGAQNMMDIHNVDNLQVALERVFGDLKLRAYEDVKGVRKLKTNTVAGTLLGSGGTFVEVLTGTGNSAAVQIAENNFNALITKAIEGKQAEILNSGRVVDTGDVQDIWRLVHGYVKQYEDGDVKRTLLRQIGDVAPTRESLVIIQELIAQYSGR